MDPHSSILDIDVGNSRTKWRVRANDSVTRGAIDRAHILESGEWPKHSTRAHSRFERCIARPRSSAVRLAAISFRHCARIRENRPICGRRDLRIRRSSAAWRRSLALRCSPRGSCPTRPFIVFGLGTAGTADFVDGQGMHKGGFIVPGLRFMTEALFGGTADVHVDLRSVEQSGTWHDTPSAVRRGVVLMLCGLRQRFDSPL